MRSASRVSASVSSRVSHHIVFFYENEVFNFIQFPFDFSLGTVQGFARATCKRLFALRSIEARGSCAAQKIARGRLSLLLRGLPNCSMLYMCNMPREEFNVVLGRSRGCIGRVRASVGAPPTAGARSRRPKGPPCEIPGVGKRVNVPRVHACVSSG